MSHNEPRVSDDRLAEIALEFDTLGTDCEPSILVESGRELLDAYRAARADLTAAREALRARGEHLVKLFSGSDPRSSEEIIRDSRDSDQAVLDLWRASGANHDNDSEATDGKA